MVFTSQTRVLLEKPTFPILCIIDSLHHVFMSYINQPLIATTNPQGRKCGLINTVNRRIMWDSTSPPRHSFYHQALKQVPARIIKPRALGSWAHGAHGTHRVIQMGPGQTGPGLIDSQMTLLPGLTLLPGGVYYPCPWLSKKTN